MKAALIVMTIMGCDDSATICHYLDTVERSWPTVAACDAQAETHINRHQHSNYPVIAAVCKSADSDVTEDMAEAAPEAPVPPETAEERQNLAARTLAFVRKVLPDGAALKAAVTKPVHYAEDGYHWVVKRFVD